MAFRTLSVAWLLSSLSITGCGTVANLAKPGPEEGGKTPFGGVQHDVACLKAAEDGEGGLTAHPKSGPGQHPQVALAIFYAADLPLCLVPFSVPSWRRGGCGSSLDGGCPVPNSSGNSSTST